MNDGQSLPGTPPAAASPGEALSKRCVTIIKTALKHEIWPSEGREGRGEGGKGGGGGREGGREGRGGGGGGGRREGGREREGGGRREGEGGGCT